MKLVRLLLLGALLAVAGVFLALAKIYELTGGTVADDYIAGFQSSRLARDSNQLKPSSRAMNPLTY